MRRRPWKTLGGLALLYVLCLFVPALLRGTFDADPGRWADFATFLVLFISAVPLVVVATLVALRERDPVGRTLAALIAVLTGIQLVPIVWAAAATATDSITEPSFNNVLYFIPYAVLLVVFAAVLALRLLRRSMPLPTSAEDLADARNRRQQ